MTAPADLTFGRGRKRITGPTPWTNPLTGLVEKVYTRVHTGENKVQLFAITNNGSTLGRVHDSRYKTAIAGGAKFPLGTWRQGEHRVFEARFVRPDGRAYRRRMTITILDINLDVDGQEHCLKFRWTIAKPNTETFRDDNTYTYCPAKGLVSVVDN